MADPQSLETMVEKIEPKRATARSIISTMRDHFAVVAVGFLLAAGLGGIVLLLHDTVASATPTCTITFTNAAGGDYFTAANWTDTSSMHRVPSTSDYACIPSSVTGQVTFSTGASSTVDGIDAAGSGGFKISSGTLTVTDTTNASSISNLTFSSGTISGTGSLTLGGATTWSGGAVKVATSVPSGATVSVTGAAFLESTLQNDGTVSVAAGDALEFAGGTLTNNSDGTVKLSGNTAQLYDNSGTNAFTNSGTLDVAPGSGNTDTISVPTTTSMATLPPSSGTLDLTDGGTLSGSGTVPSGATLSLGGSGTYAMSAVTLSGSGTVVVNGPTLTLTGTTTIDSALTFSSGTISGTGSLTLGGATTWSGGAVKVATSVPSGASVSVTGAAFLESTLQNDGTVSVAAGDALEFAGGTLTNNSDGTVKLSGNTAQLYDNSGTNAFTNSGTLDVAPGSGNTDTISVPTTTSMATLPPSSGTLDLTDGGTLSGSGTVPSGATLSLGGSGTYAMSAVTLSGSGTVVVNGPTLTLTGTTTIDSALTFSSGTISGTGSLTLGGATTWSGGAVKVATSVPSGATVSVTGAAFLESTLQNDGTVSVAAGDALEFAGGTLTNNSDGTVKLSGNTAQLYDNSGTNAFTNSGTLDVAPGSGNTDTISVPTTTSMATLPPSSGTLDLTDGGTLSGSGTVPSGATLSLGGSGTYAMSAVTLSGSGTVVVNGPTLTLTGTTTIDSALTFSSGTISGTGSLTLGGATTWSGGAVKVATSVPSGASVSVTGAAFLESTLQNDGTVSVAAGDALEFAGGTLTNNSDGTVKLSGNTAQLYDNSGTNAFTNSGTLDVAPGSGNTDTISVPTTNGSTGNIEVDNGTLSITTLTNVSGTTLSGGKYTLTGVLKIGSLSSSLDTNSTDLILNSSSSDVENNGGSDSLSSLAANTGTLSLIGGRNLTTSATTFTNSGTVDIGDGAADSTLTVGGHYLQSDGATVIALGSTLTPTASTASIEGGLLSGAGTVTQALSTSGTGTVENASTAGPLNLGGGYSGTGAVDTTITSASVYDAIDVHGAATLTGSTLALDTNPGFTPTNGEAFTILTCTTSCTGPFASVTGNTIPGGGSYQITYGATSVTLTVQGQSSGLTITTASLPSATRGKAYKATLAASGGTPPYKWKLIDGTKLPKGLKLVAKKGTIKGKPKSTSVTTTFTIEVIDKDGATATKSFTITVS